MIQRDHLESIVQKRKVGEVYQWFNEHFIRSPKEVYMNRCPFLIIQGPTGCGKTSTLKCVARELKISVQEYSETTDTTAINYDLANIHQEDTNEERTYSIDKRKAAKFERFIIEHMRFTTLYPTSDEPLPPSADSEFESDDDFLSTLPAQPPPKPKPSGLIVHIEAPLSFSRSQKILIQTVVRLIKMIRDLSRIIMRRIAIVFESLDCDRDALSLPTKLKKSLGIQTIKFNPIIRVNMKRFIEARLRNYPNLIVDKEAIELLVNDCDGDLRACINTLDLLRNRSNSYSNVVVTHDDFNNLHARDQANKRQRLNPQRLKLNPSLLRDVTKSLGFFHTLGKIFYQKRLYPERYNHPRHLPRAIDRPYRTENSTEYLMTRLEVNSKNLIAWLHHHYNKFCHTSNIDKAALFLDYLSDVDTISITATQSSQFYEMHNTLDQMQSYIAIESSVFSLYEDQSKITKSSHKKITTDQGTFIIKPSIENSSDGSGEMYSFGKPVSFSVPKLIDDRRIILSHCTDHILHSNFYCPDPTKILVDYVPYISYMSRNWTHVTDHQKMNGYVEAIPPIVKDQEVSKLLDVLETLEWNSSKLDFEQQHESLIDIIEDLEQKSKAKVMNFLEY